MGSVVTYTKKCKPTPIVIVVEAMALVMVVEVTMTDTVVMGGRQERSHGPEGGAVRQHAEHYTSGFVVWFAKSLRTFPRMVCGTLLPTLSTLRERQVPWWMLLPLSRGKVV